MPDDLNNLSTPEPGTGPAPELHPEHQPDVAAPGSDAQPDPAPKQYKYKSQEEAEAAYKELERKLGHQGTELGTLKQVIERLAAQAPQATPVQPQAPAEEQPPMPPDPADFPDGEYDPGYIKLDRKYLVDNGAFKGRLAAREELMRAREADEAKTREAAALQLSQTFEARMQTAIAEDPDLASIRNDPSLPCSPLMAEVVRRSEAAPKVLRWLHDHRAEARAIATNPNAMAALTEMARLEARLTTQAATPTQTRTVSQAPEPVRPVGGTKGTMDVDLDKVPIEEFMSRRNKAQGIRGG